ncbi:MAG: hypothetical protein DMF06_16000 [Verrucomicrobia bacterium]|nr:MAG: hypothetical protein DMF06_16000 [Verrucomicrobiota bacterium]
MPQPPANADCDHANVTVQAGILPATSANSMLVVTIRIHCPRCGCDWDVFRVPLDAKQKLK